MHQLERSWGYLNSLHEEIVVRLRFLLFPLGMIFGPPCCPLLRSIQIYLGLIIIHQNVAFRGWLVPHTQNPPHFLFPTSHLKQECAVLLVIRNYLLVVLVTLLGLECIVLFICDEVTKRRDRFGPKEALGLDVCERFDVFGLVVEVGGVGEQFSAMMIREQEGLQGISSRRRELG